MKSWRAKYYTFKLGRTRKLVITVRRFKTAKARRAQSFRQLVVPIDAGLVKEVAIRLKSHKRQRRQYGAFFAIRRLQSSLGYILIALGLAGLSFFGSQLLLGKQLEPVKTFAAAANGGSLGEVKSLGYSVPTLLSIPSVKINAGIISVGKDSNGGIQMPPLFAWTTGWYKYSPAPGQIGPAVIVGHVDNYKTISVFWRLRDVRPGDIITISRADAKTVKFKVTALKQFSQQNFPTAEVYGNINYPGLRLITCGGAFDRQTGRYTENTVVFAKAMPQSKIRSARVVKDKTRLSLNTSKHQEQGFYKHTPQLKKASTSGVSILINHNDKLSPQASTLR